MREEIKAVNKAYKREPLYPSLEFLDEEKRWTSFTYNLNGRHQEASGQLARAIRLMPMVLLINKRIKAYLQIVLDVINGNYDRRVIIKFHLMRLR